MKRNSDIKPEILSTFRTDVWNMSYGTSPSHFINKTHAVYKSFNRECKIIKWRCYYSVLLQPGTNCLWILNPEDQESYLWRLTGWVLAVDCVRSVSSRCRSLRPLRPPSVSVDCTRVCRPCSIRWIHEDPLTTYHSLRILYWNGLTTPLSRSRPTGSTWKPKNTPLNFVQYSMDITRIHAHTRTLIRSHFFLCLCKAAE